MKQEPEKDLQQDKDKLRRWVSNLQLESWQLELLITGFSIFLLATSLDEYDAFRRAIEYNRISPSSDSANPFLSISVITLINTIPWALRFFLINLLIHLLLRGFWIGIVGLSSVSSEIHFDGLKLKGKFRKDLPGRVKTLDQLIVFLDKMSSVIFAYTYLLVFSIISVMLVLVVLIALFGIVFWLFANATAFYIILGIIVAFVILLVAVGAALFFIDTLTFSALKRSKWFSVLFYPIYRFFSMITLSFLYRSIYYHLITNYKRKHIILTTLALLGIFYVSQLFAQWDNHNHFPKTYGTSEYSIETAFYDDTRGDRYINSVSIPSKFVDGEYLELFIRYRPNQNAVMNFLCPGTADLNNEKTFMDGFNASLKAQKDSTLTVSELLGTAEDYAQVLEQSVKCLSQMYEVSIDGEVLEDLELSYYIHPMKRERGFLAVIDLQGLERKRHVLEVKLMKSETPSFVKKIEEQDIKLENWAKLSFWTR